MQLQTIGTGPFPDIAMSHGIVTVGGVSIDVRERQSDIREIIDIRATGHVFAEGEGTHLVASICIPPRRYTEQPTGEQDENGNNIVARVAQPLDLKEVRLTLWPYA